MDRQLFWAYRIGKSDWVRAPMCVVPEGIHVVSYPSDDTEYCIPAQEGYTRHGSVWFRLEDQAKTNGRIALRKKDGRFYFVVSLHAMTKGTQAPTMLTIAQQTLHGLDFSAAFFVDDEFLGSIEWKDGVLVDKE